MSMFPPHDAIIHRNEAGEPIGWDVPSDETYYCDFCGYDHADGVHYQEEEDMEDEDYGPGEGDMDDSPEYHAKRSPQDTWPDIDEECQKHINAAFLALNQAPGYRETYQRVQQKLAEATRILRGME